MDDAFVRIFEFLQTEKLTTVHFFHHMDKDGNGKVDVEEFEGGLQEMGLQLTRVERKLCVAHALSSPPHSLPEPSRPVVCRDPAHILVWVRRNRNPIRGAEKP